MTFKDNPEFVPHEVAGTTFYTPVEITSYHKSRELAMQVQDGYSRCGISREVLTSFADKLLEFANKQNNTDTLKTDIGTIANNLKYRMTNVVDQQCIIRMGALAVFLEGEDPNTVVEWWTAKKVKLASEQSDIYAFFLELGIAFTPEYNAVLRGLRVEEYLTERQQVIDALTLPFTRLT